MTSDLRNENIPKRNRFAKLYNYKFRAFGYYIAFLIRKPGWKQYI